MNLFALYPPIAIEAATKTGVVASWVTFAATDTAENGLDSGTGIQALLVAGGIAVIKILDRRNETLRKEMDVERRKADAKKDEKLANLEALVQELYERLAEEGHKE